MRDTYDNYEDLCKNEELNKDYRFNWRKGKTDSIIIAPHGGNIEPGTTEIADAVADKDHSFYSFEGIKPGENGDLHITSTSFDEPYGVNLVKNATKVLAIHGCGGEEDIVYIGGLDISLKGKIQDSLIRDGFRTGEHDNPELKGIHTANICNRGKKKQGVQLELSFGLRKKIFFGLNENNRNKKTALFERLVLSLKRALINCE
jgi:phage replication-related protein YjqB (UPF0714/DUF867 family)